MMNYGWFIAAMATIAFYGPALEDCGLSQSTPDFWILLFVPVTLFIFGMNHGREILRNKERKERKEKHDRSDQMQ